jgi:beta-galactosidase
VGPLAEVTPKLIEVGHVHRNLVVTRKDTGEFALWNRFLFTWADEFEGRWQLVEDGVEVASGRVAPAHVAPLSRGDVTLDGLDVAIAKGDDTKERFVNVSFATKRDMPWAKAGWVVAREQIAVGEAKRQECRFPEKAHLGEAALSPLQDGAEIKVQVGNTVAVFSRKSGLLTRLSMKGVDVLKEVSPGVPAGPHLTCVRAFVDNDKWLKDSFLASGLVRLGYHPEPLVVTGDCVKAVINVTGTKGCGFKHECTYRFSPDGSLTLENTVTPYGVMPKALPRLGLTMRLDPALEHIKYYGRGPWENYIDRCTGSFVGLYESTVTEQYVDYVRPQDNGYKSGVRWAEFIDGAGKGVRFEASEPLFMQALHFGWEDIFLARHDGWQKHTLQIRRYAPPVAQRDVILNLDVRQTGLGGASVGPATMEKYRFDPSKPVSWTLRVLPTADGRNGKVLKGVKR